MANRDVMEMAALPKITIQEKKLTVLLAQDNGNYCAICPELDLVTEMETEAAALNDLLEAMRDYAHEYLTDLELYLNSPNRAHHYPYIKVIATCKTNWDLKSMLEIRYGNLYI